MLQVAGQDLHLVALFSITLEIFNNTYLTYAEVAQLVEHIPEEDGVAGSSPALGTKFLKIVLKIAL